MGAKRGTARVAGGGVRARAAIALVPFVVAGLVAGCDDGKIVVGPPVDAWEWTALGGPDAATPALVGNHETLVVVGGDLLLGTADGVWRRPLAGSAQWARAGLGGFSVHALAVTADGGRIIAAGTDPEDDAAPTVWYSTSGGTDWVPAAVWPRGAPGGPEAGLSFPFYTLEPDPADENVVYGGLDADSIAVTVDGGATWVLANGAESPNFGDPCVPHRPKGANVLLQGCELPLDTAWLGALDVNEQDRFALTGFRFVFGYPNLVELGNRRINSIVAPPARANRILVGVEGGLVELTSKSGSWSSAADVDARWIYRSESDTRHRPYAYIRAIAPLGDSGRPVLFGGTVNGENEVLSLFEENGGIVRRIDAPFALEDPRVEQAVRLDADDVLIVISDVTPGGRRTSKVYRLRRD